MCISIFCGCCQMFYTPDDSHFCQQRVTVLITLHSHQHLVLSQFDFCQLGRNVSDNCIVFLVCFALITGDTEHFFICLPIFWGVVSVLFSSWTFYPFSWIFVLFNTNIFQYIRSKYLFLVYDLLFSLFGISFDKHEFLIEDIQIY